MSGPRSPIGRDRRPPASRVVKGSAASRGRYALLLAERWHASERIKLLAQAVKSVTECVYVTDRDDKILFVNQALLDAYGYRESDVVGKPVEVLGAEGGRDRPSPRSVPRRWPAAGGARWPTAAGMGASSRSFFRPRSCTTTTAFVSGSSGSQRTFPSASARPSRSSRRRRSRPWAGSRAGWPTTSTTCFRPC